MRERAHLLDHHVRIRAIANEVTEAPGLIGWASLLEHGLEGRVVGMDVRNDQDTHDYSRSPTMRSMIASATSALLINGRVSLSPFSWMMVTRLVSTPKPAL